MVSENFVMRLHCPACVSTHTQTIYQRHFSDPLIKTYLTDFYGKQGSVEYSFLKNGDYILEECIECGLIYQKQILNDFFMEKLYEEWINPTQVFEEEEKTFGLDYYARYAQEIGMIISFFDTVPTQLKFLDFGMGWGKWLKMASGFGVNAYGMELSQSRIDYAKQYGIKIVLWDELSKHQFDLINTEQVFEHIPQPLETLTYLKKALKQGGLLKISVPNGAGIKKRLKIGDWTTDKKSRNSLNAVSPLEHINCFNHNSIIQMANKAGLRQVTIPLITQYSFLDNNTSVKGLLKNLIKPIYRNLVKGTYLFFTPIN